MNQLKFWIPILGLAFDDCTPGAFRYPILFGLYQILMCIIGLVLLEMI